MAAQYQENGFEFRPMKDEDVATLAAWAQAPRIKDWFDDPDYASELSAHLSDDRVRQWVVWSDRSPAAYVQDYRVHGWETHPLGFLPKGSRGIDMFLAKEALMGQGLGPRILAQHCAALFEQGAPALGIDPHPDNTAALRCYEKVGFRRHSRAETPWGRAVLMTLWPNAGERP